MAICRIKPRQPCVWIVSNIYQSMATVRVSSVSSLPVSDTVVLLSVKKTKQHFTRPPSVYPPPLSGLCWFNPGGQQPGLTAPRHCHVIYGSLWEGRGRWPLRFDPCRLISHSSRSRQHSDLSLFTHPNHEQWRHWAWLSLVVGLGSRSSRDKTYCIFLYVYLCYF